MKNFFVFLFRFHLSYTTHTHTHVQLICKYFPLLFGCCCSFSSFGVGDMVRKTSNFLYAHLLHQKSVNNSLLMLILLFLFSVQQQYSHTHNQKKHKKHLKNFPWFASRWLVCREKNCV